MTPNRELMTMRLLQQLRQEVAEMRKEMRHRFDELGARIEDFDEHLDRTERIVQAISGFTEDDALPDPQAEQARYGSSVVNLS